MNNQLSETFGIEFPIFAFSHCRDVVAAVTNAGGMGVLGALAFSPDQLELELKWIDEHVGGRPYGVDVVMPVKSVDRERGSTTRATSAPSCRELIPQTHWDYVDKILADHGVDVTADTEVLESGAGHGRRACSAGPRPPVRRRSRSRSVTRSRCSPRRSGRRRRPPSTRRTTRA